MLSFGQHIKRRIFTPSTNICSWEGFLGPFRLPQHRATCATHARYAERPIPSLNPQSDYLVLARGQTPSPCVTCTIHVLVVGWWRGTTVHVRDTTHKEDTGAPRGRGCQWRNALDTHTQQEHSVVQQTLGIGHFNLDWQENGALLFGSEFHKHIWASADLIKLKFIFPTKIIETSINGVYCYSVRNNNKTAPLAHECDDTMLLKLSDWKSFKVLLILLIHQEPACCQGWPLASWSSE